MQLHVHVRIGDLDEAERTVLALGGTKFDPALLGSYDADEHARQLAEGV